MAKSSDHDTWSLGHSYDEYMGRWSRAVAARFLDELAPAPDLEWVDVGCGTGALAARIAAACSPLAVTGVDPSADFVAAAAATVTAARFEVGTADALPLGPDSVDVVASALAYNFVPDRPAALAEFRRVCRPGGTLAFYVWDYPGGGVGFIDEFWRHASVLDPAAGALDEAARFPFCTDTGLAGDVIAAGFVDVTVRPIEIATPFVDFDAFWYPFTLGAGPAPGYLAGLEPEACERLRGALAVTLHGRTERLTARAWAVTATNP